MLFDRDICHETPRHKKVTSEPVKIAGSFATNSEVIVELLDSFVNNFFTCSTTSSCLTAPAAAIT